MEGEIERREEAVNTNLKGMVGQIAIGRKGSVGTLDEWCKRKREEEEEGGGEGEGKLNKKVQKEGDRMTGIILKEIRELKIEGRVGREEVKEGMEGIKREIEGIKMEIKMKEENWEKERERMRGRIERLERMIEEGRLGEETEKRIGRIEESIEKEERQKRRKNLIFKGIKGEKRGMRESVESIGKEIGVSIDIEEIKEIKAGKEEKGRMVIVKVKSEESRRKILENKGKLRGKEVWIEEDQTFKERKMKWKLRRIAGEEERRGERVRIGYGKLWIGGKAWLWDEKEEELRDEGGRRRREVLEEREGKGERKVGSQE